MRAYISMVIIYVLHSDPHQWKCVAMLLNRFSFQPFFFFLSWTIEWQLIIMGMCAIECFPFLVYTHFNSSFHCVNEDNVTTQFHYMLRFHLHPFKDNNNEKNTTTTSIGIFLYRTRLLTHSHTCKEEHFLYALSSTFHLS